MKTAIELYLFKCGIRDQFFMGDRVRIRLDPNLSNIKLPYKPDFSVILEKMKSTGPDTPLYELINVAMNLFDQERVRDLIFTHGCWNFTNEEVSRLLREAILEGNLNMVRLLLPFHPNLESSRIEEISPLWGALLLDHRSARQAYAYTEIAKELIRAGANVNEILKVPEMHDEMPIHYAISDDISDELIDVLIEHGANINATTTQLQTPLTYAMRFCRLYVIKRLLSCGARIDFKDSDYRTLLHIACESERAEEILPMLFQYNIDVNAKDITGANALNYLISCNPLNEAAGELLLRNGVSLVSINNDGLTPLQEALQRNKKEMAYVCLRYFAKFIVIDKKFCDEDMEFLYTDYKTYFQKCLEEFKRMEETEVYNHIKFSYIFSKSMRKLMNLVRNGDFLKEYKKFNIHQLFPTLYIHLGNAITIIIENCEILKSTEEELTPIFSEHLPILVINKIAYYVAVDKLNLI